jgi:hypothetical protein
MNRIYQGRVTSVEVAASKREFRPVSEDPKEARRIGESILWEHHELFQDAVNYYVVALASLGTSPESPLTRLRGLLVNVWEVADRKGQRRQGMRGSLQRAWQLAEPPTLEEAVSRFKCPLLDDGVDPTTSEKAAEFLLFRLGGDAAIQKGGREFLPMFCDVESKPTYKLSAERRGRANDEKRLETELNRDLSLDQIFALKESITLGSVVNLEPDGDPDTGEAAVARLKAARERFADQISAECLEDWLKSLDKSFCLPKRRGGNINVKRADACTLFLAFPNQLTKSILQGEFRVKGKSTAERPDGASNRDTSQSESRFIVNGDDPIKLARGSRGCVFRGFTALPLWDGDGRKLAWKEFDIAAFKEALKIYNQFQQNVEKRTEKLKSLATKLLVMDGERAMDAYQSENDAELRNLLQAEWTACNGKPKPPGNETGEEVSFVRFIGDPRIERLRKIINDDLAEEYRLTDGKRTAYGLRRRTTKGWNEVKRKWQAVVKKGVAFSEVKKKELQEILDDLRGGEKREQIGSHKLFSALISDEAAWSIWREPDDAVQDQIIKNQWAADPLEAFREYSEIREAVEEVSARPLNFTPADPRYSRRLFLFTDACSFGTPRGEYNHDLSALAVTVPVAIRNEAHRFSVRRCRISYSAPRLLRDRIRGEDGTYAQDWVQPMTDALLGGGTENANPQDLKDAAVQLMPDFDAKGALRILLNFPLSLDEASLCARIGKSDLWQKQFVSWKNGSQLPFLRWSDEFDGREPHRWWEKLSAFRVLAADLGTRHAASIALLDCEKQGGGTARPIGTVGEQEWFARYRSGAILRLPGENMAVFRPESPLDHDGKGKAFREELHGEHGRPADEDECREALVMMEILRQPDLLGGVTDVASLKTRFSFPELNDKLLVAIRRAQGWIATCISWHWKIIQPDSEEQKQTALQQIREQDRMPEWKPLAEEGGNDSSRLRDSLHLHISAQRRSVQEQLLKLTQNILPLRGRTWEWVPHPEKPDCHILRQTQEGTGPEHAKLRGQRGLSMARIEQLSELRRRWQSLNQSLRREIGQKPLTASEMRNDPIPDPCPDILRKLENIREQRVNQTAHLIVAEALGLKLRSPQMSAARREATNTHGEYEVIRPPVDFIVLEDLSRYLSDQGRAKSENTRLMKWCHRAITLKVKMLAEPFGIPVLETPASYSSRFCSLTGIAGFRTAEVGWRNRDEFPWRILLQESAKARAEGREIPPTAAFATALFAELETISRSDRPNRTLLAPLAGGPIFVTAKPVAHPAPGANRKNFGNGSVPPIQADLNAAANLALRAVAHPACASIHHRLRSERKTATRAQEETITAREPRRFRNQKVAILLRERDGHPKERNTNFFCDEHSVADFGRARLESDDVSSFPYASGPGIWKKVNDRIFQLNRCLEINAERIRRWGIAHDDDPIPM